MKPIYKQFETDKASIVLTLNLVALMATLEREVQADDLDRLCVRLVRPGISGALLLTKDEAKPNHIEIDGDEVTIVLGNIPAGRNRVNVVSEYGTNTQTLAMIDIVTTADAAGTFTPAAITTPVVKQTGDETGVTPAELAAAVAEIEQEMAGKADGSIYRVGESGDPAVRDVAKIHAHSVEMSAQAEATGLHAVAEGSGKATGVNAHAEGEDTLASGENAHAEGEYTTASGDTSHAEGGSTTASGYASHAEGGETTASGDRSHAEGEDTTASGYASHAEGEYTTASGDTSHAEGEDTTASGYASHAEGNSTTASGYASHAEGEGTIASSDHQHVSGKYNDEDNNGDYALIIGNGTDEDRRSNAFAIDWDGNLVLFNNGTPVVLTPAKLAQLIA